MPFPRLVLFVVTLASLPLMVQAQTSENATPHISIELNALQDVANACRMTFLAQNRTGTKIDEVVFETVIFDTSGSVVSLSLFDFRELPADRPRVRQFDLPGMACDAVGQALINGANTCLVDGVESKSCDESLRLNSRVAAELVG